jgi:hypothetical protein
VQNLADALRKTQTDRRMQPTWEDMLHELREPSPGSFYKTHLEGNTYGGIEGMIRLPPLAGDPNAAPMDIISYATNAHVRMLPEHNLADGQTESVRDLNRMFQTLERVYPAAQNAVVRAACAESATWPDWAQQFHAKLQQRDYRTFEDKELYKPL